VVRLAMYKGKGHFNNAIIRWWTKSIYSHCELVLDGDIGYSSSMRDGGVRGKSIDFNPEHWDFIELPFANAWNILEHFRETRGRPYGLIDLFWSQFFNRPNRDKGDFCSEWCAAALGLPNPSSYSPQSLYDHCVSLLAFNKRGANV